MRERGTKQETFKLFRGDRRIVARLTDTMCLTFMYVKQIVERQLAFMLIRY